MKIIRMLLAVLFAGAAVYLVRRYRREHPFLVAAPAPAVAID